MSGATRRVRAGGARGLLTRLSGASPYGGPEANYLLTVARPEGLFFMLMTAPQREADQVEVAAERMVKSIQFRM